jgi:hypothetical protein
MPKPTAVVFPGFISLQKMGAHETLFNHKLNSEWNGKEPIKYLRNGTERSGLQLKTRLLNGTEENIYIYVTV